MSGLSLTPLPQRRGRPAQSVPPVVRCQAEARHRSLGCLGLLALLVIGATPAAAHEIWPGLPGVVSMVLHPFLAPEIVLVMMGMALLAGVDERRTTVLLCLPMAAVGVAVGLGAQGSLLAVPGLWRLPMIVAIGLGLLVASGLRIGQMTTLIAALLAAATVGLGVPRERPFLSGAIEAGAGVAIALAIMLAVVALPRARLRHPIPRIAARVAGAWIAAIALLGLAAALR